MLTICSKPWLEMKVLSCPATHTHTLLTSTCLQFFIRCQPERPGVECLKPKKPVPLHHYFYFLVKWVRGFVSVLKMVMWLLWMCKQVYFYTNERLYCIKVQYKLYRCDSQIKLKIDVLYSISVQHSTDLHHKQTLELYTTEHLYACVAVHKLLKAK